MFCAHAHDMASWTRTGEDLIPASGEIFGIAGGGEVAVPSSPAWPS
jgi:hypothetical protein